MTACGDMPCILQRAVQLTNASVSLKYLLVAGILVRHTNVVVMLVHFWFTLLVCKCHDSLWGQAVFTSV